MEMSTRHLLIIVVGLLMALLAIISSMVLVAEGNRHKTERFWDSCLAKHTASECYVLLDKGNNQ